MLLSDIEELDLSRQQVSFSNNEVLPLIHKAVEASCIWDIGLGFFAFSGFRKLAWPLAKFLINGGVIRLYCNEFLSEKDYSALIQNGDVKVAFDLFDDLLGLYRVLEKGENDLFANCISHLISSGKLQVRVLVRRDQGRGYSHHASFGMG